MKKLTVVLCLCVVAATKVAAQENSQTEADFPQRGLLAAEGRLPASDLAIPLPVGIKPGSVAPITGGISRDQKNNCLYQVTNNFGKKVSVTVTVGQFDSNINRIASQSATHRLKPNETAKGQVNGKSNSIGCGLMMESWKFLP